MKLLSTRDGREFEASLTTEHPASIPGPLAVKRLDNGQFIALRDCIGVPGAPGSTLDYQFLEVSPQERERLGEAGLIIAETPDEYLAWLRNWNAQMKDQNRSD